MSARISSLGQADELCVRLERRLNLFAKLLYDNAAGDVPATLTYEEEITLAEYLEDLRDDARRIHLAIVGTDPFVPPGSDRQEVLARLARLCAVGEQ